jgi:hypothetical protein
MGRLLRCLIRRRLVEDDEGETRLLADELALREPALAQLAAATVAGLPPAGPELHRKPLTVGGKPAFPSYGFPHDSSTAAVAYLKVRKVLVRSFDIATAPRMVDRHGLGRGAVTARLCRSGSFRVLW